MHAVIHSAGQKQRETHGSVWSGVLGCQGGRRYLAVLRVNISSGLVAEKGERKVGCPSRGDCYSLLLHTSFWTVEEKHVPRRGSRWTWDVRSVCLLAGYVSRRFSKAGAISVLGMLTKWLHITRLETRTEETIMFASVRVENSGAK